MANLTYTRATVAGAAATAAAASAGGDTIAPDLDGALLVDNGSGASITVTIAVPGNTKYGQPEPDITVAVPAGAQKLIGPLPRDLADPADGLVHITYSDTTSLTVLPVTV